MCTSAQLSYNCKIFIRFFRIMFNNLKDVILVSWIRFIYQRSWTPLGSWTYFMWLGFGTHLICLGTAHFIYIRSRTPLYWSAHFIYIRSRTPLNLGSGNKIWYLSIIFWLNIGITMTILFYNIIDRTIIFLLCRFKHVGSELRRLFLLHFWNYFSRAFKGSYIVLLIFNIFTRFPNTD